MGIGEKLSDSNAQLTPEGVHEYRVTIKRARAYWRLLKKVVRAPTCQPFDDELRALAHHLAPSRDAAVQHETLDALAREAELPASLVARVQEVLASDHETSPPDTGALAADARELRAKFHEGGCLHASSAHLANTSKKRQLRAFERALERTYRAGRRKLADVETTSDPDTVLHDLRKQVKYHGNQLLVLRGTKKLTKRQKQLSRLGSLLGEHHDLAQLAERVSSQVTPEDLVVLLPVITRQKVHLEQRALPLAKRLYSRKPRRFLRWLRRHSGSVG
jgi:CHAD domain-containing protein